MSRTLRPARSLADDLRARSDENLHELFSARPDLLAPLPADITALATRASSAPSISRVLDGLNKWELQVLEILAVLPEPVTTDSLLQVAGANARPVYEKLLALALLYIDEDEIRILNSVGDALGPEPAGLGPVGLGDRKRWQKKLEEAPAAAKAILDKLTWGPPRGTVSDVKRPPSTVSWLLENQLLTPIDNHTVALPREVGIYLRGNRVHKENFDIPPNYSGKSFSQEDVDNAAIGAVIEILHHIEELLHFWAGEPAAALRSGGLGVREVKRACDELGLEEKYLIFIAELAYISGYIGIHNEEEFLPTTAFDIWRNKSLEERWIEIAGNWLATSRVTGLVGKSERGYIAPLGPEIDRSAIAHIKRLSLSLYAEISPVAVDIQKLAERITWERPRKAFGSHHDFVHWIAREAQWLGFSGRNALTTFGSALLHGKTDVGVAKLLPKEIDYILIQGDNTAIAPGPLQVDLAREMSLIANVESKGGATVYRLSEHSIRRALDNGRGSDEIKRFLAKISKTPLPQPLEYMITDIGKRYGILRVGISLGSYIRCEDEALVAAILADKKLAHLQLRQLDAGVLMTEDDTHEAIDALVESGYFPALEDREGALIARKHDKARAKAKPRPPRIAGDLPIPSADLINVALRSLRAGDKAAAHRKSAPVIIESPSETMSTLTLAIKSKAAVSIGYADSDGGVSERVIEPIHLVGGILMAYDHGSDEVLRFSVSRISGVAIVE
jgi:hypothetical protein